MGFRRLAVHLVAAASAVAVGGLAFMAAYAAGHPQFVETVCGLLPDRCVPNPQTVAANRGAIEWPALLGALALLAVVGVLRRPGRVSFVLGGAVGVATIGAALWMPGWLAPVSLAVLLSVAGSVGLIGAVIGWFASEALPETPPGWPWHHGGI
jgi:hypothetical protein